MVGCIYFFLFLLRDYDELTQAILEVEFKT